MLTTFHARQVMRNQAALRQASEAAKTATAAAEMRIKDLEEQASAFTCAFAVLAWTRTTYHGRTT